jgi:ERCC4-type nuclease
MPPKKSEDKAETKKKVSDVYLIVDSRERAVAPFIETECQEHAYVSKQINTGDYLICRRPQNGEGPPVILACIERKTHEDFAASFKDGRYGNIKKMLALRKQTKCQLYYLIEGPAFPNPNRRFARIPYSSILAAITKLMVRDGAYIIQTEDEAHSAKRLVDLMRVFDTEIPYVLPESRSDADDAEGEDADANLALAGLDETLAVPSIITARIEQTDDDAIVNVWARLRGISVVLGKIASKEFTIAELATQKVPLEQLKNMKTFQGRPINKDALSSLMAIRNSNREQSVKLLSGIKGVSPVKAKLVIDAAGGLPQLCNMLTADLALVVIPQANRSIKLGKVCAERIKRLLHYKEGTPAPVEHAGYVLGDSTTRIHVTEADAEKAANEDLDSLLNDVLDDSGADDASEDEVAHLPDGDIDALLDFD